MNGNTSRLVDNNHIFVLVDDLNWVLCNWRFMTVQGMGDEVTIAQNIIGSNAATVNEDCSP
jgi:hypothetical protein